MEEIALLIMDGLLNRSPKKIWLFFFLLITLFSVCRFQPTAALCSVKTEKNVTQSHLDCGAATYEGVASYMSVPRGRSSHNPSM